MFALLFCTAMTNNISFNNINYRFNILVLKLLFQYYNYCYNTVILYLLALDDIRCYKYLVAGNSIREEKLK